MDSKLSILNLSDDPDQWWQPDPTDDPDYNPYTDVIEARNEARRLVEKFREMFPPGELTKRQIILSVNSPARIKKIEDAFAEFVKQLKPVVQMYGSTQPHHVTCNHLPRCKPPGPGAAFSKQAGKQHRPRKTR